MSERTNEDFLQTAVEWMTGSLDGAKTLPQLEAKRARLMNEYSRLYDIGDANGCKENVIQHAEVVAEINRRA